MEKKSNKIIHYIWFGGNPLSDLTKKCIQTWKKFLPDFEIMEWNENTFDVNQCPFVKEAYEQKKWAFVADYTRFKVLEEYGGIYLDTDMEITSDISKFLEKDLFLGVEDSKMINAAVVWAKEAHNPYIKDIVNIYESKKKFNETGDLYDESVPRVLTKYFEKYGFNKELDEVQKKKKKKIYIYPMEYFYPLSYDYQHNKFTDNSVMIHHFDATWISPMEKFKTKMKRKNMIWVVYVIDFFINLKNKIKFFSNYRDLSIFAVMFITMLLAMFSFVPIEADTSFSIISRNLSTSIVQILVMSGVWTFICAKIRNIDLNYYSDKMTNTDSTSGEYRKVNLNLDQTLNLYKREKILYAVQMILTILVSFFPLLELTTVIPNNITLYMLLSLVNMYFIYLGIKKNYLYRILELIPYALIQAFLILICPSFGIITSVLSFAFIMYKLVKNKVKPKRIKSYGISYAAGVILAIVLAVLGVGVPSNVNSQNFGLYTTIDSSNIISDLSSYKIEENITEFNAGKNLFGENLNNISNNFMLNPNLYLCLSVVLSIIVSIVAKKPEYLMIGVLAITNAFGLFAIDSISIMTLICCNFVIVLLLAIQIVLDRILNRE